MNRTALQELLATVSYLEDQPEIVIAELTKAAVPSSYRAGSIIFVEGEPCKGLFIIEKGVVKIGRISKEGREHILHRLQEGQTFNDIAALDGGPTPATATACTDVLVWCICRPDLKRISSRYESLSWALVESAARRARYLVGLVQDLALRNVRGRLANLLLEEAASRNTRSVPKMMTQEEMASRLGTVREVVGRALRGLAGDGIIEFDRHRIVILDLERLEEEAEA